MDGSLALLESTRECLRGVLIAEQSARALCHGAGLCVLTPLVSVSKLALAIWASHFSHAISLLHEWIVRAVALSRKGIFCSAVVLATYLHWLGVWDDMFMCVLQLSVRRQTDKGSEVVRMTDSEMGSPL